MLEIRCYVDDDLDEVITLWYRSWTNAFPNLKHPQSFEEWKLRFQNDIAKRANVWVAQAQSRIVGFIVIIEAVGIIEQIIAMQKATYWQHYCGRTAFPPDFATNDSALMTRVRPTACMVSMQFTYLK